MTTKIYRLGHSSHRALSYIAANPGVSIADVDRVCRTAKGGHKWMYATVARLLRAGLVKDATVRPRGPYALIATEQGRARLSA